MIMKKTMMIFVGMFFMLATLTLNAQNPPADYFAGKWNILIEGTPSGDSNSILILKRVDGKLKGTFQSEGKAPAELTRVEEEADEVTCYFVASGYDVYLFMEKLDENKTEGTMMDMFDAYGTRAKEEK